MEKQMKYAPIPKNKKKTEEKFLNYKPTLGIF